MKKNTKTDDFSILVYTLVLVSILIIGIYLFCAAIFGLNIISLLFFFFAGILIGPGISMVITSQTTLPNLKDLKSPQAKRSLILTTLLTGIGFPIGLAFNTSNKSSLAKIINTHAQIPGRMAIATGAFLLLLGIINFVVHVPSIINALMDTIFGSN